MPTPMSAAGGRGGGEIVSHWNALHAGGGLSFIGNSVDVLTLDHVDVVGSVSDGQCHGLLVLLHQTDHVALLLGCDAAADDCLTLAGHVHKVDLQRQPTAFVIESTRRVTAPSVQLNRTF